MIIMRTEDEEILQQWIPTGDIETRFFNYENMIAFAKHYKKLKEGQALPLVDVSGCFSADDMEDAYRDGYENDYPREWDFNIDNYR